MSWYIGLGRTSCENETWSSHRSSRPYGTVRVPDMDPPPSSASAISLFILVFSYSLRRPPAPRNRASYFLLYVCKGESQMVYSTAAPYNSRMTRTRTGFVFTFLYGNRRSAITNSRSY